jgi:hypothetical protein
VVAAHARQRRAGNDGYLVAAHAPCAATSDVRYQWNDHKLEKDMKNKRETDRDRDRDRETDRETETKRDRDRDRDREEQKDNYSGAVLKKSQQQPFEPGLKKKKKKKKK